MKRYIILSVNDNPQYLFYLPLTIWCWRYFGWHPVVFNHREFSNRTYQDKSISQQLKDKDDYFHNFIFYSTPESSLEKFVNIKFLHDNGYKSETITQISRLYAACVLDHDSYIMTGDIDMIPLSDYWHPKENEITIYGHDLTGYGHYPICYIGMSHDKWVQTMGITTDDYNALIKRDLDELPQAKSDDSVKRWVTDQDLITDRVKSVNFEKTFINRGTYSNGYAKGRIDRSAWHLNHSEYIDAHLMRDIYINDYNLAKTFDLLHTVWPNESFEWFMKYVHEFKKLV